MTLIIIMMTVPVNLPHCAYNRCIRLANTRNTGVKLPHLGEVYQLLKYTGANRIGRMVQFCEVRTRYSVVASVE